MERDKYKKLVIVISMATTAVLFSFYVSASALTYSAGSEGNPDTYKVDIREQTEAIAQQAVADINSHLAAVKAESEDQVNGMQSQSTGEAIAAIERYKQDYLDKLSGATPNLDVGLQGFEKRKEAELEEEMEEEAQKMILKLFSE